MEFSQLKKEWINYCIRTSRCSSWIYERQRNQRSNCQHSLNHQKSKSSRRTSALLIMPKPLTVSITTNCGKFFKRWEYQTTWPASWEICMKQQLELEMEQQTHSKLGKEYAMAIYCHPVYLTYIEYIMRNVRLDEAQPGRLPGEISITSDMQMTPPLWQKAKKN